MEVLDVKNLSEIKDDLAAAMGFFDGVHLGHQQVINNALHYAKENRAKSLVITFDESPKVVLKTISNSEYLTPITEKLRILENMGVDFVLVLKFDALVANLTAAEFIDQYLLKIGICYLAVGFDFMFGNGREGNANYLQSHGGFKVDVLRPVLISGEKVSTTRIKDRLKDYDFALVNYMMGRRFSLSGEVVYGQQLGRKIGFPTANLKSDSPWLADLCGVYATFSYVDGVRYKSMTNIGFRPTMSEQDCITVETYIFSLAAKDANLYGKLLRIEFLKHLRNEIKFSGIDELAIQLEKDKNTVDKMSFYD